MKTALVSGAAGFIGGHIAAACTQAGYEVTRVDVRTPGDPVDARDFFRRDNSLFDVVVHCAAVVGGRRVVIGDPLAHAQNLETDAALFAWARRTQPGRVVYFSSSCAYPVQLTREPYRRLHEDDIAWPPGPGMMPDELYGWTKLTGEFTANTARNAGVAVSVVRPFSVYGPGMADGFAVKGFADQVRAGADPVEIWGDENQVRDFIHVDDVARAVMAMAGQEVDGPVNLGTGTGTSLRDLAVMMARAAGREPRIRVNPGLPAGVPRLVADPQRLNGFCPPQVRLEEYIAGLSWL